MQAMAGSNCFRAGGAAGMWGAQTRLAGLHGAGDAAAFAETPAGGSGCPFPGDIGVCSPAETHGDLGWVSPFCRSNLGAICPSWSSHPPVCMDKHPSPPHGHRRPAGLNPSIWQGKSTGDPPQPWVLSPGDAPPPEQGDALPQTWGMLPLGARGCSSSDPGDAPCRGCCKQPPFRAPPKPPVSFFFSRQPQRARWGPRVSPPSPRRRLLPGPACAPAAPGAPARAAGTCSSGGP